MGFLSDFRSPPAEGTAPAWGPAPTPGWSGTHDAAPASKVAPPNVTPPRTKAPGPFLPGPPNPCDARWSPPSGYDVLPFYGAGAPVGPRRRSPLLVVGVIVVALALVGGVAAVFLRSSGPSLSGVAPDRVLGDTLVAARKAQTVHGEATEVQDGEVLHITFDISATGGSETMTASSESVKLIAVGRSLYIDGDQGALRDLMGLPDSLASQYAGQWISVPADSGDLQQAAQELRTPIVVGDLLSLSGPISATTPAARHEVSIQGSIPNNVFNQGSGAGDRATLSVSSRSPFLPVSLSYSDPQNGSMVLNLSNWGERVTLAAPANSTPLPSPTVTT